MFNRKKRKIETLQRQLNALRREMRKLIHEVEDLREARDQWLSNYIHRNEREEQINAIGQSEG